ncbi:hypothetical protein CLU79DRAFT_837523 [Phycomyces nitens]|nr:hypothetical protein CLU79DRAFT_837523 [Phycomyces nitens]
MDTDDSEKSKNPWPPRLASLYESKLPPSDRQNLGHHLQSTLMNMVSLLTPSGARGVEPYTLLYEITAANVALPQFKDDSQSQLSHTIIAGLVSQYIGECTIMEIVMTTGKRRFKLCQQRHHS